MPKIIQRGEVPGTKPIQAECRNCKSVIEFLPIEAKYNSDQRDGDFYSLACPVCEQAINASVQL